MNINLGRIRRWEEIILTLSLQPLLSSYFVSMWIENLGRNEHWERNIENSKIKGSEHCKSEPLLS